jgi:hypothetical protein
MAFAYAQQCAGETGSPEDGQLALQIAINILKRGTWFLSQTPPSAYADGIAMLADAAGPNYTIDGPTRLDTFDSAIRCLRSAQSGVDPQWFASEFSPRVASRRQDIVRGFAQTQVQDVLAATDSNPRTQASQEGELLALELRLDHLSDSFVQAEDFFTMSNMSVAHKLGKAIDWGDLLGDRIVPDPLTGSPTHFNSGAQIGELILRMKSGLRVASAASKGLTQPSSQSTTGQLAEAFDIAKNVMEGTVGLAGLCAEGVSWTFAGLARVSTNASTVASLTSQAEAFSDLARSIASAPGVSGALAGIDIVRHGIALLDSQAEDEDRLDAGVGLATALVNAGGAYAKQVSMSKAAGAPIEAAAAAAGACTAASVAIPLTWLVFKSTIRELGTLRIGSTRRMMADSFDMLVGIGNGAAETFKGVTTALMMRDRELDPDMRRGFDATANGYALDVSEYLSEQRRFTAWGLARVAPAQLAIALDHPGSTGTCRDPTVVLDAVNQLTRHITWCLENAEQLVADESGLQDVSSPTKNVDKQDVERTAECEVTP